MTTDLTRTDGGPIALADFDPRVVDIVRSIVAPDLDDIELAYFLRDCTRRGLDPLARQAYAFKSAKGKVTTVVGIDGFRAIAQATGEYRGQTPPEFTDGTSWSDMPLADPSKLVAARVGVLRAGFDAPVVATAVLREHAQRTDPWRRMPHVMLAKCAEAQALRRAFPHQLSGAYTQEELHDAPDAIDVTATTVTTTDGMSPNLAYRDDALTRLRVLGTTVAAIANLHGDTSWNGLTEADVYDRIVKPKAAKRGVEADLAFVEELIVEAEERYAVTLEARGDAGTNPNGE